MPISTQFLRGVVEISAPAWTDRRRVATTHASAGGEGQADLMNTKAMWVYGMRANMPAYDKRTRAHPRALHRHLLSFLILARLHSMMTALFEFRPACLNRIELLLALLQA